jgi:hypothetical protein
MSAAPFGSDESHRRTGGRRLRRLAWNLRMLPRRLLERHVRSARVAGHVRHRHGPPHVDHGPDEVVVICVVRNGAPHVDEFIGHHLRLGVRHIVLLDNGSTDDTVLRAVEHERTTVLETTLPYGSYENVLKRYLAERFSRNRWSLCADVDERFDYPFSRQLPLHELVRYLDRNEFTILLAHMLDMFADGLTNDAAAERGGSLQEAFPYYDLTNVTSTEYEWGSVPDAAIRMYWGGIRHSLFGTRNGLTKAALARVDPGVELFHDWHHVSRGRIADVTGLLLHYPFAGSFRARVADAVATRRYGQVTTAEYRRYARGIRRGVQPDMTGGVRRLADVDSLLETGFLVASDRYRALLDSSRQGA